MTAIIVCFESGTAAAQFEREAKRQGVPGRLTSAPRGLQVSCGLAWAAPAECEAQVLGLAGTIPHGVIARYDWDGTL